MEICMDNLNPFMHQYNGYPSFTGLFFSCKFILKVIAIVWFDTGTLFLNCCCCCSVVVLGPRSEFMWGQSVNLTTFFLGRLRPPKRLTSTLCTYFCQ